MSFTYKFNTIRLSLINSVLFVYNYVDIRKYFFIYMRQYSLMNLIAIFKKKLKKSTINMDIKI